MKMPSPNTALHRTPAAAQQSPVSFQAFGETLKTALVLLGAIGVASTGLGQTGTGDPSFIGKAAIRIERNASPCADQHGVARMNWQAFSATSSQIQIVRRVLVAALRQNRADEETARRHGQVTGGVPGCVSNDFRLTLEHGERRDVSVLHLCAGWLAGERLVGSIVFSTQQKRDLATVLGAGCS